MFCSQKNASKRKEEKMKKLISFALVVVMLLSTLVLSSCDEALKILNDYLDSQNNVQKEIRNTVTDEEWADILQSNNFTYTQQRTR